MTISPLEIYLVLQLDRISNMLELLSFFGSVIAIIYWVVYMVHRDSDYVTVPEIPAKIWAVLIVAITTTSVIPSSNTAAAMIILPPLVNEGLPAVGDEARELYDLAKQALENAVRPEPETPQR